MSVKHNTRHPERGRSNYPKRLARRGLTESPVMEPAESLRARQEVRVRKTGYPQPPVTAPGTADAA